MVPTQEKRMEVYESLSESLKKLYSSEEAAALNRSLIEKYSIPLEKVDDFLNIIGDVILGFHKISDMPQLFQQKIGVSADESQRMTSRVIEFLGPVVKREEEEAKLKRGEMTKLVGIFAHPEGIAAENKVDTVVSDEDAVLPLRTMEDDMNRVHGYGAYQEQREKDEERIVSTQENLIAKKEDPEERG
jgi:hypothetical protein